MKPYIHYLSVRDARKGTNVAILDAAAFDCVAPVDRQTWYLYLSQHDVNFLCAHAIDADDYWTFHRAFFDQMPPLASEQIFCMINRTVIYTSPHCCYNVFLCSVG